jgi:hypothetical protein
MINVLLENIQEHLSLLDMALTCSEKIIVHATKGNLDAVINETENRERLVNVIGKVQGSIEDQINQLDASALTNDDIMILKAWFQDLAMWSEKMMACDRATIELLGQQKEETTKEISSLFKNKEMFKGYNHAQKK